MKFPLSTRLILRTPDGNSYITPGAYLTEGNYIRVYFNKSQTEQMIESRNIFNEVSFWTGLFGGIVSVPVGVILAIANKVSSDEVSQIIYYFNKSSQNGVCYYYWRYDYGTRKWAPWYKGSVVGELWQKLY